MKRVFPSEENLPQRKNNYFQFELTANRTIKITPEEKHFFAEDAYFEHAQNNEIIRMVCRSCA